MNDGGDVYIYWIDDTKGTFPLAAIHGIVHKRNYNTGALIRVWILSHACRQNFMGRNLDNSYKTPTSP